MHLALTDRLACPRCGPDFGLILLAEDVRDHRILEGELGCSNCRERYPVRDGFGDLRVPPRSPLATPLEPLDPASVQHDEAVRLGALMGVAEGPGTLLIQGPAAEFAFKISEMIGGVEVVGMNDGLAGLEESDGVSRMIAFPGIPFFSGSFLSVLLSGPVSHRGLQEAVRVAAPGGRVVVLGPPEESAQHLETLGMEILLQQEEVLVTRRSGAGSQPLITLRGL